MPGSEIPDSSSFHSNESNESRCHHHPPSVLGPLDSHRDIETLNEDLESEFMADSEGERNAVSPSLNALDSGNEDFRFTTGKFCADVERCFKFFDVIEIERGNRKHFVRWKETRL